MDEVFYRIADAARILEIKEHNVHDAGSMGELPIYVCSLIFNLFYLKVTVGPDDVEDYFNESEIQAPWNENTRLPSPEHMQLSTTCLKRYFAGDLEAKVVPKPDIENGNLLIRFGLYNSDREPLKVKDVNLRILATDVYKFRDGLNARQELKHSNPDNNVINDDIDSCIDGTESSENTTAIIKQKDRNYNELKQWLFDTWETEGRLNARAFFPRILRRYVNKTGSPITQLFSAGVEAGISYRLSTGNTGDIKRKTIQNYISQFKKLSGK
jgi:hypothetical protein